MTRDDVIRWAREAGAGRISHKHYFELHFYEDQIEDFAALVAAAEREACAALCETSDRHRGPYFADKIRARGQE